MWGIELVVMLAMIAVNSVLAAYEIALASITLSRLQRLAGEHRRGAADAVYMKENMEASLAVIQLGITLVAAIAAAVGGAGAAEQLEPWFTETLGVREGLAGFLSLVCVIVPLTVVTIVFGELVPKVFALRNSQTVCLRFSPPMRWFSISVRPIVWFFETVVRSITSWGENRMKRGRAGADEMAELHDLRASVAMARASALIGTRQEDIIIGAAEMQQRPVSEIMLPSEHISTLDAHATLTDNLLAAHLDMHTRFPVERVKGDPQTIIGYVNVKDLISTLRVNPRDASMHSIIRKLPDLRTDQPLLACLEKLLRAHTHIAIVRDPQRNVVGMITLEDIIEEMVGEIHDEYDRLPGHIAETGSGWTVGGGVTMRRLRDASKTSSPEPETDGESLNDWAIRQLGRGIEGGDMVEAEGLRVLVRKVRRQQLQEASVSLN